VLVEAVGKVACGVENWGSVAWTVMGERRRKVRVFVASLRGRRLSLFLRSSRVYAPD
jgi:hypothetical protein